MDQVRRVIYQFEGRRELEQLTALLGKESAIMVDLVERHKQGSLSSAQYAQQAKQTATAVAGYVQQIDALERQLKGAALAVGPKAVSAGMKTQGIQQLGYAIQDFISTSGGLAQKFNSVTNNIQGLAAAFVPSAWGFVAITGFTSAVQLLFNNAGAIADWFNGVDPAKLKAQAKKVKELEKKGKDLETALEEIRKAEGKTQWSDESGAVAAEAIKGAGGVDKVRARLADQYASESAVMDGAQKALRDAAAESDAANAALAAVNPADFQERERRQKRKAAADKALSDAQARVAQARKAAETKAGETLVGATEGDTKSVYELAKRFGGVFNQATIDGIRAADKEAAASMAETETTAADRKFRKDQRDERKRVDKRTGRQKVYDLEIEQAGRTSDEEAKIEQAFKYIKRRYPNLNATEGEIVGIAEEARKAYDENPRISDAQAARLAVNDFQAKRDKVGDAAQLDELQQRLNVDTGGIFTEDQIAGAAKQTQTLMNQGMHPMAAAQQAIGNLLQANQMLLNQMQQFGQGFTQQANQAAWLRQQAMQMQQIAPSLLDRGW